MIKLNKYIEDLQKILKKHGNLQVIYAKDDEGNAFYPVNYSPSVGNYSEGEFDNEGEVNSVCVN